MHYYYHFISIHFDHFCIIDVVVVIIIIIFIIGVTPAAVVFVIVFIVVAFIVVAFIVVNSSPSISQSSSLLLQEMLHARMQYDDYNTCVHIPLVSFYTSTRNFGDSKFFYRLMILQTLQTPVDSSRSLQESTGVYKSLQESTKSASYP